MLIEYQTTKNGDLELDGLEISVDFWVDSDNGYESAIEDTDWMLDKRGKSRRGQRYVLTFWHVTIYMENNYSLLEFKMWK